MTEGSHPRNSGDAESLLDKLESQFSSRFTEDDEEFMRVSNQPEPVPPIIHPWERSNRDRHNRRYDNNDRRNDDRRNDDRRNDDRRHDNRRRDDDSQSKIGPDRNYGNSDRRRNRDRRDMPY